MTTFTPKGLIKPGDGDSQDVEDLNTNYDRQDAYGMGPFVCTSLTRPTGSNRWDGMLIWETDTKTLLQYDSSLASWLPANGSFCRLTQGVVQSIPSGGAYTDLTMDTANFNTDAGSLYALSGNAIQIKRKGWYELNWQVVFDVLVASVSYRAAIAVNNVLYVLTEVPSTLTSFPAPHSTIKTQLNVNDTVKLQASNNNSSNTNTRLTNLGAARLVYLEIKFLSGSL